MKKKIALSTVFKKVMKIIFASMIVAGMGTAFISGKVKQNKMVCTGLEASVEDSLSSRFIKAEEVAGLIVREYGEFEGKLCRETDLAEIEEIIDKQDAVRKSQVWFKRNGMLNVEIDQREPLLRFQLGMNGFYADREGVLFPLQKQYTANVIVVDGALPVKWEDYRDKTFDNRQQRWLDGAVKLAAMLKDDMTWNGKISQIHCSSDYGMMLIPKEGQERFIFGEPDNLESKIMKMGKYYTHIKPLEKEKEYKRIDLRYEGQIICK